MVMMFAAKNADMKFIDYTRDGRKMAQAQLKVADDYGLDCLLTCSDPAREVIDIDGEGSVDWFPDQGPAINEDRAALLALPLLFILLDARRSTSLKRLLTHSALALLLTLATLLPLFLYHWAAFGSPFRTGSACQGWTIDRSRVSVVQVHSVHVRARGQSGHGFFDQTGINQKRDGFTFNGDRKRLITV